MNLIEKSLAVNELFKDLAIETQQFNEQSQLKCLTGCGKCCANPKVPATVLEFLPLAFELYHTGVAEGLLAQLEESGEDSYCVVLHQMTIGGSGGLCSHYSHRGLICRLFGSSARRNREGKKELITCKLIKEDQHDRYQMVSTAIQNGMEVPGSADYYTRLYAIDFHLAEQQLPINMAIRKALEAVYSFYYYIEGEAV
ncbi:YkgJ family cysteine cluster protein [Echinicola soli]|uniref:YkgJ family cysteine cluster protein n=1 Tax=Echinicola soli TaxID=2591634 RepID=UPI001E40530B|nr:YkgJ family cysteine cluster protein [Echinicola soli]